ALSQADPATLAADLASRGRIEVRVEGNPVVLDPESVKVEWRPAEGFVVSTGPEGAVALDLRVDETLRAEGDLRELVHRLQLARKEAGFLVTDRIEIGYDGELGEIFRRFADRIRDEVLAVAVREGALPDAEHEAELEVHGRAGQVWLKRSGEQGCQRSR
ncbi:MAG: DUF5915 domain-containing protein, partial [Candidatus Bipolaricaulis sp.]|nr:DUF5915 domain-containing protein [Candidatus Bipolaricaulis sp.]